MKSIVLALSVLFFQNAFGASFEAATDIALNCTINGEDAGQIVLSQKNGFNGNSPKLDALAIAVNALPATGEVDVYQFAGDNERIKGVGTLELAGLQLEDGTLIKCSAK